MFGHFEDKKKKGSVQILCCCCEEVNRSMNLIQIGVNFILFVERVFVQTRFGSFFFDKKKWFECRKRKKNFYLVDF